VGQEIPLDNDECEEGADVTVTFSSHFINGVEPEIGDLS
jgi:hypothetical protein